MRGHKELISRRRMLQTASVAGAAVFASGARAAEDPLWKLWVRYVTGGAPYRPSFPAMFLDPMFVEMDIVPADLPFDSYGGYNPLTIGRTKPATPPQLAGFGNADPIVPHNAPDVPWIPSIQFKAGVRSLMPDAAPVFSVLVLNDQSNWPDKARDNVQQAVNEGWGFVIFHHAIGDNQSWPWWYQEATGGHRALADHDGIRKTVTTPGTTLDLRPVGNHPILQDIGPMRLTNEVAFKGMWQSPKITPLLETSGGATDRVLAWIGPNPRARIVCIQPGVSPSTHRDPAFRKLVRNAILWAGGRLD